MITDNRFSEVERMTADRDIIVRNKEDGRQIVVARKGQEVTKKTVARYNDSTKYELVETPDHPSTDEDGADMTEEQEEGTEKTEGKSTAPEANKSTKPAENKGLQGGAKSGGKKNGVKDQE